MFLTSRLSQWRTSTILGFLRKAGQSYHHLCLLCVELRIVAEGTISRAPEIITATPGASADSTFRDHQLLPLKKGACLSSPPFTAGIEGLNVFATARKYIRQDLTVRRKIAVLNLASDQYRAGGWRGTLCRTQVDRVSSPSSSGAITTEPSAPNNNRKRSYVGLPPYASESASRKNNTLGQISDQLWTRELTPQWS